MRFLLPMALTAALMIGSAAAQTTGYFWDGNELLKQCDASDGNVCRGYVMGIADAMAFAQSPPDASSLGGWRACISANVTDLQLMAIVKRSLHQHPEQRHFGASSLVARAIAEAFPCSPAGKP